MYSKGIIQASVTNSSLVEPSIFRIILSNQLLLKNKGLVLFTQISVLNGSQNLN